MAPRAWAPGGGRSQAEVRLRLFLLSSHCLLCLPPAVPPTRGQLESRRASGRAPRRSNTILTAVLYTHTSLCPVSPPPGALGPAGARILAAHALRPLPARGQGRIGSWFWPFPPAIAILRHTRDSGAGAWQVAGDGGGAPSSPTPTPTPVALGSISPTLRFHAHACPLSPLMPALAWSMLCFFSSPETPRCP